MKENKKSKRGYHEPPLRKFMQEGKVVAEVIQIALNQHVADYHNAHDESISSPRRFLRLVRLMIENTVKSALAVHKRDCHQVDIADVARHARAVERVMRCHEQHCPARSAAIAEKKVPIVSEEQVISRFADVIDRAALRRVQEHLKTHHEPAIGSPLWRSLREN